MKIKQPFESHTSDHTSRREFAKTVASTLLAAPLAASIVRGQAPTRPPEATTPPAPPQTPAPPSPLALAYYEVARLRFGEKLTPEQLEQIKKDLEGNLRAADRLRSVKLKNGDEPDFIFMAGYA